MKKIVVFVILAMIFSVNSFASTSPKLINVYKAWEAYTYKESSGKVCYMASVPTKSEGKYTYRGDIIALITHRPGDASRDVFSFTTGYSFKVNSEVTLKIDNKKWTLFTDKDTAWAKDEKTDREISKAIQKGSKMTLEGYSSRGTYTKDTFSLRGSTAAYQAISRACGIKY